MKMRYFRILWAALVALLPACGGGHGSGGSSPPGTGGGTGNPAFPVTMTEPSGGQTFTAPATISLSAVTNDPASVSKVEFLQGGHLGLVDGSVVTTFAQPPFQTTLTDVPAGIHTFVARMTDKLGAQKSSSSVTISVLAPGESPGGWMPIADVGGTMFVDANQGWGAGFDGQILHTVDGGASWVPQSIGTSENLHGIQFVDAERGWVVGDRGTVFRTTDGGVTWTSSSVAPRLWVLSFVDSDVGWVTGDGDSIFVTKDGGVTWTPLSTGVPHLSGLGAFRFVDRQNGWIFAGDDTPQVEGHSFVLHTTDGGLTWTEQFRTNPNESLWAMAFVSETTGWISRVGIGRSNRGILFTSDGGATWTEQTHPGGGISALDFISPTQGWAAAGASIIHTEDGGASWVTQATLGQDAGGFGNVQFLDPNLGWATGRFLFKTTTGGKAP